MVRRCDTGQVEQLDHGEYARQYRAAARAARERIRRDRGRMSLEDAQDIVAMELRHHGVLASGPARDRLAFLLYKGPWWTAAHPLQMRREMVRLTRADRRRR